MVRVIHRFWAGGDLPGSGDLTLAGVEVQDWTDATVPCWMLDLADDTVRRVAAGDELRHRANVVRLGLLYEHGGWWADHDLAALGPFTSLPSPATAAHRGGHRCNCWLAFPAGHPALSVALDAIRDGGMAGRSMDVSGENLLQRLWGDDIGRVALRFDFGVENPAAPRVLTHEGRTAVMV